MAKQAQQMILQRIGVVYSIECYNTVTTSNGNTLVTRDEGYWGR